jgi:hypothetical protein
MMSANFEFRVDGIGRRHHIMMRRQLQAATSAGGWKGALGESLMKSM